jgi:Arc/MetJ-type ribon-helix-helix transcriptional regulator
VIGWWKTGKRRYHMSEALPADLEQYVGGKVASGAFGSREEFLVEAVRVYRELDARHELLKADVRAAVDQADHGMSEPLDVEAIKRELAEEIDDRGQPK